MLHRLHRHLARTIEAIAAAPQLSTASKEQFTRATTLRTVFLAKMDESEQPRKRARIHDPVQLVNELEAKYQTNGDATTIETSHDDDLQYEQQTTEREKERAVGITAFAGPQTGGFSGLLKTRFASPTRSPGKWSSLTLPW